ncbi:MAG: hypothetical protein ACRESJ_14610 [Pseudomonas sp.]|uniref:hypothetical protein n=1 Tax=Pseudomonas sp. TaxID=306 RepID=UPI003D6FE7D3
MAAEGKQSPFTFKSIALWMLGVFFSSWAIPKSLDYFFDTTLLNTMMDCLLRAWNWLLLDTSMPIWSLLMLNVVIIGTLSVAIYYYRTTSRAYGDLNEAEQTIYKLRNPEAPALSRSQVTVLMSLANLLQGGLLISTHFLSAGSGLDSLEVEIVLEQLADQGYVKFPSENVTSARIPTLTLKGKEYVQARRKRNAELAEQKKALPESKVE